MKYPIIIKKMFFLVAVLFVISSCSDNDPEIELSNLGDDYLVFGHFYGECGGEGCIETYALTADKLYEDTADRYIATDFEFVELPAEKFDLVIGLENSFPQEILNETDNTFGCPDCGDWGGIYLEYVKDGERKSWRIDVMLDDIPAYMRDFVTEIQEKIALINE